MPDATMAFFIAKVKEYQEWKQQQAALEPQPEVCLDKENSSKLEANEGDRHDSTDRNAR